jgi:hypothetical protein
VALVDLRCVSIAWTALKQRIYSAFAEMQKETAGTRHRAPVCVIS